MTTCEQLQQELASVHLNVDIDCISFHLLVLGSNTSPLLRCSVPSCPPTAYSKPRESEKQVKRQVNNNVVNNKFYLCLTSVLLTYLLEQ